MSFKPSFEMGTKVVCVNAHGYRTLTEGRIYTVREVHEPIRHDTFTFPEYVTVTGDFGKGVVCYPHRFKEAP